MATHTVNANPGALRAVQVQSSTAVSQALPSIRVGDVVRFSVRQNQQGGGLIYLNGNLIKANLPQNLENGARLLARVANLDDQVLFKILDVQRPFQSMPGGPMNRMSNELGFLLRSAGGAGLRGLPSFQLPVNLENLGLNQSQLQRLFQNFATPEMFGNSNTIFQHLLSSANGDMASGLRSSAMDLRTLLQESLSNEMNRFLLAFRSELETLLNAPERDFSSVKSTLQRYMEVLARELPADKGSSLRAQLLHSLMEDLRLAADAPQTWRNLLEGILEKLENAGVKRPGEGGANTIQRYSDLQTTALRLEQMAQTQELLNQLNPLMQALGEPALLLFPSLFQGLVMNNEITIQADARRRRQQKQQNANDEEPVSEPFQRIQVQVPLPSLGEVGVDIAYRDKEILVRLVTDGQEKADFLLEQLQHLSGILRGQGFEKAELSAAVGSPLAGPAAWTKELQVEAKLLG